MRRVLTAAIMTGLAVTAGAVPAQSQPAQSQPAQSQPAQSQPAQSQPAQSQPAGLEPATTSAAPEAWFAEDILYRAGMGGYSCFRIPAVVRTTEGTVLAFAEGRVRDCGDDGDIDLVLRRSFDNGRTWDPLQVVADGAGDTRGNPSPIVDSRTGRVVLLTTYNPGDNDHDRRPFVQYSDDDGATWSQPRELTDQISRPEWNRWYATGPMHGIQLGRGSHAGRMVVGVNHQTLDGTRAVFGAALVYSDDGGTTWQVGADQEIVDRSVQPQEMSVVELIDGRLYVAARDQYGTDPGHRAYAISGDGGESYDVPFTTIPELSAPVVQGSTLRLHAKDQGEAGNRILFSSPAHPASREVMTVRSSSNEGRTWEDWQDGKVIHWGYAAYSDMVRLGSSEIGLLYEGGERNPYEAIRWARFNESFLDTPNPAPPGIPGPPAPGPVTPDVSGNHNTAYLRGGARLNEGRDGPGITLDGVDDQVELPLTRSLDLGADDFTLSTWFRYGDKAGSQVLLWGYRVGHGSTPGVWLRAEPQSNRIRGFMGADLGTRSVSSDGAYNDGQWHHVALRRAGDLFSLYVDGRHAASVAAPAGSVTTGKEFGISGFRVGARLDDVHLFQGSIDDVRIYRRALSATEIDVLHNTNPDLSRDLELRLPFDTAGSR